MHVRTYQIGLSLASVAAACASPPMPPAAQVETLVITESVDAIDVIAGTGQSDVTVIATDRDDVQVTATIVGVSQLRTDLFDGELRLADECVFDVTDRNEESECYTRYEVEVPLDFDRVSATVVTSTVVLDLETVRVVDIGLEGPGTLDAAVAAVDAFRCRANNGDVNVALGRSREVVVMRGAGDGYARLAERPESLTLDVGGAAGRMEVEIPAGAYAIDRHEDAHVELTGITSDEAADSAIHVVSQGSFVLTGI